MPIVEQQITVELGDHIIINGLRERTWKRSITGIARIEVDDNGIPIAKGNWDSINEVLRQQVRALINNDIISDLNYLIQRGVLTPEVKADLLKAHGIEE